MPPMSSSMSAPSAPYCHALISHARGALNVLMPLSVFWSWASQILDWALKCPTPYQWMRSFLANAINHVRPSRAPFFRSQNDLAHSACGFLTTLVFGGFGGRCVGGWAKTQRTGMRNTGCGA